MALKSRLLFSLFVLRIYIYTGLTSWRHRDSTTRVKTRSSTGQKVSLFFHLGCNWDVKADRVSQHQVKWAWFSFSILHKQTASSFSVISRRIMEDKSDTTSPEAVWTHWVESVCVFFTCCFGELGPGLPLYSHRHAALRRGGGCAYD